jgi:hypothetical protein
MKEVIKKEYVTFNIGSHFASYLVNGDATGLDDDEQRTLETFLSDLLLHYGTDYLDYMDDKESFFDVCEVTNLPSDCLEFILELKP